MTVDHRIQVSEFILEGSILGVIYGDKAQPKYLKLATPSGVHQIKLEKSLRRSLQIQDLASSHRVVQVTGIRKSDPRKGKLKLKALRIEGISAESVAPDLLAESLCSPAKAKILVCQKSSCRKRGAQAVCSGLEQTLSERGLAQDVKIVKTGCMKDCKAGPHIVIMPDRKRYSHSNPSSVGSILDQHFPRK